MLMSDRVSVSNSASAPFCPHGVDCGSLPMRTVLRKLAKGQEDRRKDKFVNKSCHRRVRDKRGNG